MQKAILIYNPLSGDHSIEHKLDYVIKRFMENGILLQPYRIFTSQEEKLEEVLEQDDYVCAVISGGDGTLNYAVSALMKNGRRIPVGIIPSGTSNDFARCLNLPNEIERCMDIILSGNTIDVDAGLINDKHYFLSTCAGGLFVDVSFSTHSELKRNFGPFAYYLQAISEVANINPFHVRVETESETIEEDILLFLILNGKHAAGFQNLIEEADLSDGIMDIVLIKNCSHMDLATLFFNVLSTDYVNNKNAIKLRARSCSIKSDKDIYLSVDGEKGEGLPVDIKFINRALTVYI